MPIQNFSHASVEDMFKDFSTLREDIVQNINNAKGFIVSTLQDYFGGYGTVSLKAAGDHMIVKLDADSVTGHVARLYIRDKTIFFASMCGKRIDSFFTINGGI